jgi:hypothetical protein
VPRVAIDIGVPDGDEVVGSTVVVTGTSEGLSVGLADVGSAVIGFAVVGAIVVGDEVVGSAVGSTVVAIGASVGPSVGLADVGAIVVGEEDVGSTVVAIGASVGFADVGLTVVGDIVEGTPDGLFEMISVRIVVGGVVEESSDGNNVGCSVVGCSVAGISVVGVSVCTGGLVEVVAAVGTPVVVPPIISVGANVVGSGLNVGI